MPAVKRSAKKSAAPAKSARTTAKRTTTAAKTTRGAATASRSSSTKAKGRTPNAAFMAPLQPDPVLAAVVGAKPLPRTQVTKKLWDYIKRNDLQDATKRTFINADANLKALFGGKARIDMFQMTKFVSQHLTPIK